MASNGMDTPLNRPNVALALAAAASQNLDEMRRAEFALKRWESSTGFYTILAQLCAAEAQESDTSMSVRWMAVVYFKNSVDVCWRKHTVLQKQQQLPRHTVPPHERAEIRAHLLHALLNEPVPSIAVQTALLVAKVARCDCPREWPQLIPTLMTAAGDVASTSIQCQRALLALHHIVKALASKRLMTDRRVFHELASVLMPAMMEAWHHFDSSLATNPGASATVIDCARFVVKIVRRLVAHGARTPSDADVLVSSVICVALDRCRQALVLRKHLIVGDADADCDPVLAGLSKYAVAHLKFVVEIVDTHPFSLVVKIGDCLSFGCQLLFSADGQQLLFRDITLHCLCMLRKLLLCPQYRVTASSGESIADTSSEQRTQQAHTTISEFFGRQPLEHILGELVRRYIPLTSHDLQAWDNDPEAYYCCDDSAGTSSLSTSTMDGNGHSMAPYVECLFVGLFRLYKSRMTPLLLSMMQQTFEQIANARAEQTDLSHVLARDALYTAVGWAAFDLYDDVDFDGWLTAGLLQELSTAVPHYRVVRRRVIWLIGRWVGVKISARMRPNIYAIIVALLDERSEDLVVRLTTAQTLRDVVDDFEFNPDDFAPFLGEIFARLFRLLVEVRECDTKMRVLNVISLVIERLDTAIQPHCAQLVTYLPQLWQNAGAEFGMLCAVIVTTLTHLVQGLAGHSTQLYHIIVPVLSLSTDLQEPAHVYLMDDALVLWRTTIERADTLHPEFLQLFARLPALMDLGTEALETGAAICQAYLLLSPVLIAAEYGGRLDAVCCQFVVLVDTENGDHEHRVTNAKPETIQVVLRLLETAICAAGETSLAHFSPLLLWTLRAVLSAARSCGGGVEHLPVVMTTLLAVLSRVVLSAPAVFEQLLAATASACSCSCDAVLSGLLDVWLDKMHLIWQTERRKLCALALCSLLASGNTAIAVPAAVCAHFNSAMLNIAETLNDISPLTTTDTNPQPGGAPTTPVVDVLVMSAEDIMNGDDAANCGAPSTADYVTAHDRRKRALLAQDPVHQRSLAAVFQTCLRQLAGNLGQQRYLQLLQELDVETRHQVTQYIQLQ